MARDRFALFVAIVLIAVLLGVWVHPVLFALILVAFLLFL